MSPMPILLARARCGNLTLATVSRYSQLSINRRLRAALNEMSNVTPVCSGRWALAASRRQGVPWKRLFCPQAGNPNIRKLIVESILQRP